MIFVNNGTSYEIFVTDQDLPTLEVPWTDVDLGPNQYSFRRSAKVSKVFNISGYIQKSDMSTTRAEAEGLNNALLENPSGNFTDGYSTAYECYVTSFNIKPVAGVNKYTFTMSLKIIEV